MIEALWVILSDAYHLAQTLALFTVVGCLTAPIVYGWYHVDKTRDEGRR